MGFDERFHQDHCYFEEATTHDVGMNIEIIDNTLRPGFQTTQSTPEGKGDMRYAQISIEDSLKNKSNIHEPNKSSKRGIQQIVYSPSIEYCADHSSLFLHEDDKLVKLGDKFDSHNDFVQYLNVNAKGWLFYYKCSDSHKRNAENETYTYNCVYLRNKEKYIKKGLRQRNNNMKTDCPCKIKLKRLPNENKLTVVFVCNHHDHQLSQEEFYKLQHGRRLPPQIKEEIMDFLALQVDVGKIRKYVLMETGFNMSRPFFHAIERNMKNKYVERQISDERLKELSEKIRVVDDTFVCGDDDNTDNKITQPSQSKKIDYPDLHSKPEKETIIENTSTAFTEIIRNIPVSLKRCSRKVTEEINKRSKHDIRVLQDSVKCETQQNPWNIDQCLSVLPNRIINPELNGSIHVNIVSENNKVVLHETRISSCDILDNTEFNDNNDDVNKLKIQENLINNCIVYDTAGEVEYVYGDHVNCEDNDQIVEYFDNTQTCEENKELINNDILDNNNNDNDNSSIRNNDIDSDGVVYFHGEVEAVENAYENNNDNDNKKACNASVQTCSSRPGHSYVPVFDVYMKDGNVTGFILNNNLINKGCVEKGVQTNEEIFNCSNTKVSEEIEDIYFNTEPNMEKVKTNKKIGDVYTKHEYIHKYNIDQYMVQPHFPKYIETLAKETCTSALHMFTNVYNEKAVFKMTTTQRGKEGNTRIWYITDTKRTRKIKRFSNDDKIHRETLGKNLKDIFVLREKVKSLKKRNNELSTRNKYLEDVAHQLVIDGVVRFENL